MPAPIQLVDAQLNGRPYRKSAQPFGPNLFMPDERTLIVATEPMLQGMLQNQQAPQKGPLSDLASKTELSADVTLLTVLQPIRPMLTAQLAQVPVPPPFAGVKRLPELIDAAKAELTVTGKPGCITETDGPVRTGGSRARDRAQTTAADWPADDAGPAVRHKWDNRRIRCSRLPRPTRSG